MLYYDKMVYVDSAEHFNKSVRQIYANRSTDTYFWVDFPKVNVRKRCIYSFYEEEEKIVDKYSIVLMIMFDSYGHFKP